jgi:hypothetical protein
MRYQSHKSTIGAAALAAAMLMTVAGAYAFDESKYPDFSGQWKRPPGVSNQYDISKPRTAEEAPLTPEYQKIFEANLKDQAEGGQGTDPTYTCIPDGMPRAMNVIFPMEIVVTPKTTYVMIEYLSMLRRIYTDGRDWPENEDPSYYGYSIGRWSEPDQDGRFSVLEVETRNFSGPRSFDNAGIPLHADNQTVIKERIYLDKADRNILYDDITVFDHALTEPWTLHKKIARVDAARPVWRSDLCEEDNSLVRIGKDGYFLSADGYLMPTKKGQAPPDLRYFKQSQK